MKFIFLLLITGFSSLLIEDNKELAQTYINRYKDIAVEEMERTGIPASIKLAQGLLESDWGRSDLANTANNHFGIKCGKYWKGGTFYKEDDDRDKKGDLIKSCFRSFASPMESYMAHSDFLMDPKKEYRYGFLFNYGASDYKSWAKGLRKAGYATDPAYPSKLIKIIEKYELYKFDSSQKRDFPIAQEISKNNNPVVIKEVIVVADAQPKPKKKLKKERRADLIPEKQKMPTKYVSSLEYEIEIINKCRKVTAKGGETLESLARSIGMNVDDIIMINEPYDRADIVLEKNVNVYIEKKKRSYKGVSHFHLVLEGETMESISQLYGLRTKSLYAKNRMPKGSETVPGVKLFLTKTASLGERPKFKLKDNRRSHSFLFEESTE